MECPHCEEDIDTVTRTGDKRFSCGQCNMVISYDDLSPHLDEMNVIDKRGSDGEDEEPESAQDPSGGPDVEVSDDTLGESEGTPQHDLNDREKIYQRGREGLRELKKERLKNWLSHTEGVGSQTESRIQMVFERNETIHQNPHILYNLLDDELSASPSYINTMVEDIFSPERENEDLLQSQGYTPWYRRNNAGGQQHMGGGGGQAFNATGGSPQGFTGGGGQQQQQGQQPRQQQGQQGQQNAGSTDDSSDDSITAEEAASMVERGIAQAEQQRGSNPVREGLSDATDEALKEMATNIGGLAGTMQRVIDEALVQYARENPEWVIENMGVLQKVIGATEEASGSGGGNDEPEQPESDAMVDDAISDLGGGGGQQSQQQPQQQQAQAQQQSPSSQGGGGLDDLSFEDSGDSGFSPSDETQEAAQTEPPATTEEPESAPEAEDKPPESKPKPAGGPAQEAEQRKESFEQSDGKQEPSNESSSDGEDEFDDIFGDIAE